MNRIIELYELHNQAVFRYFLRMTGNYEEARELTQETFYQVCLSIFRFKNQSSLKTWLFSIARNVYLKRVRDKNKHKTLSFTDDIALPEPTPQELATPAELLIQKEERERIQIALSQLSENARSVIILKEYEQQSYEEIAGVLGQTVNWVRVTFYRAKKQLGQVYREMEGDNDDK
jgi:RNA polymerase sigma-70 factor (ECF subfamily)